MRAAESVGVPRGQVPWRSWGHDHLWNWVGRLNGQLRGALIIFDYSDTQVAPAVATAYLQE